MAEQIISPGVFTRENALSFLPQGVGAIGAAIIGPTEKGPAFVPTVVRNFAELERRFGPLSADTYIPQTVREYLKNAGSVTVCRVLAGGGYTYTNGTNEVVVLAASGSAGNVFLGAIYPSKSTTTPDLSLTTLAHSTADGNQSKGLNKNFSINLQGATGGTGATSGTQISASINPANKNYLFKQLGGSANNSKDGANSYNGTPGYGYLNFKNLQTSIAAASAAEVSTVTFLTGTVTTSSLKNADGLGAYAAGTGSIVLTRPDANFGDGGGTDEESFVLVFSGSNEPAVAAGGSGITGSVIPIILAPGTGFGQVTSATHATGSELAQALTLTVNNTTALSNYFTASVATSVVTITAKEAGNAVNISTNLGSGTASVATSTDGSEVTGYKGLSVGSELILITQSANMVFSGEIGQTEGYGYASTPFVTSQFIGGTHPNKTTKNLFKFHTLDHGKHLCHDYKVSIANVKEPSDIDGVEQYSQFSVILRRTNDKDKNPVILEQYNNVTLDPNSSRYISRVIGDRYPQYNDTLGKVELLGNYPNISNYIRVEVATSVEEGALSPKLSPKGFKAVRNPIVSSSFVTNFTFPSASYEGTQTLGGNYNARAYLGFKFIDKSSDNENFLQPLPDNNTANVAGDFNVENYSGHSDSALWSGSLSASIDPKGETGPTANQIKFTIPFQGGDDGLAPYTVKQIGEYITNTNLYGFDLSTTATAGYKGYKKAIDILANQDEYDVNMVAMPGVIHSLHPLVTQAGIDLCEERGDAFFVMDLNEVGASVNTAISNVGGLDTNYAAVYYPWVKVLDSSRNRPVLVPPSVIVPGAIAASDAIAAEWFAPAGLNRGVLGNVLEAKIRLNQSERDKLYDAKINPIATFPATGVCIWGQKTLQERPTALDRINVRRLLIALKKFIASSSRFLVFEQNTQATRNRFLNIVNPYLESVQQRQGLFAFRVQMDESNNTAAEIDRNQLVGAIYLQPTKTAEFIILDFNVLPTGATFDGGGSTGGSAGGAGGTGGTGGGGGGY